MRQRFIQSFPTSDDIQSALDNKELGKPYVAFSREEQSIDWNSKEIDYTGMPLTFEIISGGTIEFKGNNKTIQYRLNGGEWTDITSAKEGSIITVNQGDKVQFRAENFKNYNEYGNLTFLGTAMYNAYGNIMSLINPTDFKNLYEFPSDSIYTFHSLFGGGGIYHYTNTGIIDASNLILPATAVTYHGYEEMFQRCLNLVAAPALPAKTLDGFCYVEMFDSCPKLIKAPELPATSLAKNCYNFMFWGCTNLNYVKAMFTTTPGISYTRDWLSGVAKSGTFVKNPEATWDTDETFARGSSTVPTNWTIENAEI